ncbi:MAG: flagella basal body P-ring formation protein FlgA [Myxococcota bacterium]
MPLRLGLLAVASAQGVGFTDRLSAAIAEHVATTLSVEASDVVVLSTGFRGEGCGDALLLFARPDEDFLGAVDLRIEATDAGALCGRWRVRARLARWVTVPTVGEPVAAGEVLSLKTARVRLDRPMGTPVDPADGPFLALTGMRAGEAVTRERVRRQPDVPAGETVKLVIKSGSLSIVGDGVLTKPGEIGASITVRALSTGAILEGTLVSADRVVVGR